MKVRLLKKNNPILLSRRDGKGFNRRVMVLGFDDRFVVVQSATKRFDGTATLTYSDIDLLEMANEKERVVDVVQRHFLKKYGKELYKIKTFVSLPNFEETGKHWEMNLSACDKQTSIELEG